MPIGASALKAYTGGVMAAAGTPLGQAIIDWIEWIQMIDIPPQIETTIVGAAMFICGFAAVYFTPNSSP